jgi:hypothetical protein
MNMLTAGSLAKFSATVLSDDSMPSVADSGVIAAYGKRGLIGILWASPVSVDCNLARSAR